MIKQLFNSLLSEARTVKDLLHKRLYLSKKFENEILERFHIFFYNSCGIDKKGWGGTTWLGHWALKCPFDLWIYQEILWEQKPDLIIETGTFNGGSALFLASVFDLIGNGKVVSIDIEHKEGRPVHPRITYLKGSSTDPEIVETVKQSIREKDKVLAILDSDHSKNHVLNELRIYHPLVSKGSYLIVEDSNVNGHPVEPNFGPGPMEAIEAFLKESTDFQIDKDREKLYLTFNPNGYLRKVK